MNHVLEPLRQSWRVLVAIGIIIGISAALWNWGFSRHEIISLFSLIGITVLILCLIAVGRQLGENEIRRRASFLVLNDGVKILHEKLSKNNPGNPGNQGNPESEGPWKTWLARGEPTTQPPELKPTGGGAFAGMLIGGAVGTIGGPVGVIIGGVIGALLGNQAEYENIHRKPPTE